MKTLYMQKPVALEQATRPNLEMPLQGSHCEAKLLIGCCIIISTFRLSVLKTAACFTALTHRCLACLRSTQKQYDIQSLVLGERETEMEMET